MKIYNHILQGHEATEENAKDHARGLDWQGMEHKEGNPINLMHTEHVDTINGIRIYYDFTADYYFFADNETN